MYSERIYCLDSPNLIIEIHKRFTLLKEIKAFNKVLTIIEKLFGFSNKMIIKIEKHLKIDLKIKSKSSY